MMWLVRILVVGARDLPLLVTNTFSLESSSLELTLVYPPLHKFLRESIP